MKGIVNRIQAGRTYGFIKSEGRDYFFHIDDVLSGIMPPEGTEVEFEEYRTLKGPRAKNVEIVS